MPVQVHRVGRPGQPSSILAKFSDFHRSEEFDAVGGRIAERLQEPGRDECWNVMRLAIQHPGNLLHREAGWQLPKQR